MTREELLERIDRLLGKFKERVARAGGSGAELLARPGEREMVEELFRSFAGAGSSFYARLQEYSHLYFGCDTLVSELECFREYVDAGLLAAVTPEREARFDVVTDLLDLAQALLNEKAVHPGAAAMLIGGTLEEYLRVWVERLGLELGTQKAGIDTYARLLRTKDAMGKQHLKDITAWAGLRNDAAHGNWEAVKDRERIQIMLDGVRLFMQQHGA